MSTSVDLAEERGSFLAIKGSNYEPADLKWQPPQPVKPYSRDYGRSEVDWQRVVNGIKQHGLRNAAQTTVAPTGTIATVAGCEGYGCEPVFALAYVRHVNDNGKDLELQYTSPHFEKALVAAGLKAEDRKRIIDEVNRVGSCQHIKDMPAELRNTFVVAADISPEEHVHMQGAIQAFVDNSISKTCNFPKTAVEADVAQAYQLAWELGCKGLTVYVTGSREKVVLETHATKASKEPEAEAVLAQPMLWPESKKPRAGVLRGETHRVTTPLGATYVTVNQNGGDQPLRSLFRHRRRAAIRPPFQKQSAG
jgi:ribonucleoside-diphosphate reductase alpha chain